MTTRIIIRGAAEIEIILPAGVEPPTVRPPAAVAGNEAEQTRSVAVPEPGGSASTFPGTDEEQLSFARAFDSADQQSCGGVEADTREVPAAMSAGEVVPAKTGEPEVAPGPHDALPPTVLDEPTVANMLARREAPADLGALVREIGAAVTAAVDNPPPPVEQPAELALNRPLGDSLDLPAFLDRRPVRTHG